MDGLIVAIIKQEIGKAERVDKYGIKQKRQA